MLGVGSAAPEHIPNEREALSLAESNPPTPTPPTLRGGDFVGSEILSQMMKLDSGRWSCHCRH